MWTVHFPCLFQVLIFPFTCQPPPLRRLHYFRCGIVSLNCNELKLVAGSLSPLVFQFQHQWQAKMKPPVCSLPAPFHQPAEQVFPFLRMAILALCPGACLHTARMCVCMHVHVLPLPGVGWVAGCGWRKFDPTSWGGGGKPTVFFSFSQQVFSSPGPRSPQSMSFIYSQPPFGRLDGNGFFAFGCPIFFAKNWQNGSACQLKFWVKISILCIIGSFGLFF